MSSSSSCTLGFPLYLILQSLQSWKNIKMLVTLKVLQHMHENSLEVVEIDFVSYLLGPL